MDEQERITRRDPRQNRRTGSAPPFVPTQLAGCILWLPPATAAVVTVDGSTNVSQWNDLSGNGNNVTQGTAGNRPPWSANGGPNGRPAIGSFATNKGLLSAFAPTIPFEYFVAFHYTTGSATLLYCVDWTNVAANNCPLIQQASSTTLQLYQGPTVTGVANGNHVASCQCAVAGNSASNILTIDGVNPSAGGAGNLTAPNGTLIGNIGSLGQGWNDFIYEVAAFNRILSAPERTRMTRYLGAGWSVSVP